VKTVPCRLDLGRKLERLAGTGFQKRFIR